MKKLPSKIYVQIQGADNDLYLNANAEIAELDDGKVGVYELVETKSRRTEIHLD